MSTSALTVLRPVYSSQFRCIGPKCEDSCCSGWRVFFDQEACERYETFAPGPLRTLMERSVERLTPGPDGTPAKYFARVLQTPEGDCPFLNADRLCQIQVEHGESFLSRTCAVYPRIVHRIDGMEETALSLSCPEAARLVLLSEQLPGLEILRDGPRYGFLWEEFGEGQGSAHESLLANFWLIRSFVLAVVTDRRYALWQRLFLIGIFVRRRDALARGPMPRPIGDVLRDFALAIDSGTLRASMDGIPSDPSLQLDLVLRLASLPLPRSFVGPRFIETVEAFKTGLGLTPNSSFADLVGHFSHAQETYFTPFLAARPSILENLLMNMIFRSLFPFGQREGKIPAEPDMSGEFSRLIAQFALLQGLLIGVSGCHRESFSEEHIVFAVQSASKHFEHHPEFLDKAQQLLESRNAADLRSWTMLIRN